MADSKALIARVADAAEARGLDFSAYTERDGGPWYIVAGYRGKGYGVTRVADTDTAKRDKARAFLLHMMGQDWPRYNFTLDHAGRLYWTFKEPGGARFTVWTDEACAAFPDWAESIGMKPRTPA